MDRSSKRGSKRWCSIISHLLHIIQVAHTLIDAPDQRKVVAISRPSDLTDVECNAGGLPKVLLQLWMQPSPSWANSRLHPVACRTSTTYNVDSQLQFTLSRCLMRRTAVINEEIVTTRFATRIGRSMSPILLPDGIIWIMAIGISLDSKEYVLGQHVGCMLHFVMFFCEACWCSGYNTGFVTQRCQVRIPAAILCRHV